MFYCLAEGIQVNLPALVEFLAQRMPHFMVPRYFEEIQELPRTPTARVEKYKLRAMGQSEATWDREAVGIMVTRHGVVNR